MKVRQPAYWNKLFRFAVPAQPVDATLSDLEIPYKQVVLSLRTNLASPLQRKRLIFGPFKGPGCQFNTLEKCSVLKFLQAGLRECCDDPLRPPGKSEKWVLATE